MSATASTILPLGMSGPHFSLSAVATGQPLELEDFAEKTLLSMFLCAHCPYVGHVKPELARITHQMETWP